MNSLLQLFDSGLDTVDIAKLKGMKEAVVVALLHAERERIYRAKYPDRPAFPAEREPLVAHFRKWRNVQIAKVRSVEKAGSLELSSSSEGTANPRSVQADSPSRKT